MKIKWYLDDIQLVFTYLRINYEYKNKCLTPKLFKSYTTS
ncbi:hypothetical protein XNC3_660003 [Xenorhabdus nematophila F1]|nr:hypothetical protein XNC3_660003 [Xenorhabdus nematophila F1]